MSASSIPTHKSWEENPSASLVYALEHLEKGEYEQSIKHFRRAIELWPEYFDAWLQMGIAFGQLERLDEALDAVQRASEIAVESLSEAWNTLASLHLLRGEYDEALTVDRVLGIVDPTRRDIVHYRMGVALTQKGAHEAALEALREAFQFREDLRERALQDPLLEPIHGALREMLSGMDG
jgi:tetratricopeptide (TPR) repeat protein